MKKAHCSSLGRFSTHCRRSSSTVNAQDPAAPVPYVASVKKADAGFGGQIRIAPGNISVNGMPVRILIRQAYGQLAGLSADRRTAMDQLGSLQHRGQARRRRTDESSGAAVRISADPRGSLRAQGAQGDAGAPDLRAGAGAQRRPARTESQAVVTGVLDAHDRARPRPGA